MSKAPSLVRGRENQSWHTWSSPVNLRYTFLILLADSKEAFSSKHLKSTSYVQSLISECYGDYRGQGPPLEEPSARFWEKWFRFWTLGL